MCELIPVWIYYSMVALPPQPPIDPLTSIPRCSLDDPKLGTCIKEAAATLRPYIEDGIEELGIPSYNPLVLSTVNTSQESDSVNYTYKFTDYKIRGLDNYNVTDIQYNPNTTTFRGRIHIDPVLINSHYELGGNYFSVPIEGKGVLDCALGPINVTFEMTGNISRCHNLDYYKLNDIKIELDIDDVSVHFNGLFGGDPAKGAQTNILINRNSKNIIAKIAPTFETVSETYIKRYFKWLTGKYPLNVLFIRY